MGIVSKPGMRVKKLSCCAKIALHVLLCARIMALCNPAVAQGSLILLRHCQGVLSRRKKMSREREVNKESKRKDSKRKRCQVNGMSRERDVQRKSQEREMSRDFKRNRVQEEEIHNKVISEESSASRTRHFQVPCPTKFNVASKLRLKLCGSQKNANYGKNDDDSPVWSQMIFQPPRNRSKGPQRWRNKPQRCGQSCTRPAS